MTNPFDGTPLAPAMWIFERWHSNMKEAWREHFSTYQEALDFLAEQYGLPSSDWGPKMITTTHHVTAKRVYKVAEANDPVPTYLISPIPFE